MVEGVFEIADADGYGDSNYPGWASGIFLSIHSLGGQKILLLKALA